MTEYGRCPAFGYECEYVSIVEAQAAEIERLREIVAIMHTAFAAYADSPAKQEAITLAGKAEQ